MGNFPEIHEKESYEEKEVTHSHFRFLRHPHLQSHGWGSQSHEATVLARAEKAFLESSAVTGVASPSQPTPVSSWFDGAVLWKLFADVNARLERLEGHPPRLARERDAMADWLRRSQSSLRQFRGRHVAVSRNKEVVADGASYGEVYERVQAQGLLGQVVIEFVRP